MKAKILLAGIGGQGVLFAHRALAACAVTQGLCVTGAETHGMSQRGGSVVSHLKIGEASAPLIRRGTADFLLAFDTVEAYRSLPFLRHNGVAAVNTGHASFPDERVRPYIDAMGISVRGLNAEAIARELQAPFILNVVLLGFASTCDSFPFPRDSPREAIARVSPRDLVTLNLKAYDEGFTAGIRKSDTADRNR